MSLADPRLFPQPRLSLSNGSGELLLDEAGVTCRAYFAALFMAAMIRPPYSMARLTEEEQQVTQQMEARLLARRAVLLADELLNALE
jgi:hypothetical protein